MSWVLCIWKWWALVKKRWRINWDREKNLINAVLTNENKIYSIKVCRLKEAYPVHSVETGLISANNILKNQKNNLNIETIDDLRNFSGGSI